MAASPTDYGHPDYDGHASAHLHQKEYRDGNNYSGDYRFGYRCGIIGLWRRYNNMWSPRFLTWVGTYSDMWGRNEIYFEQILNDKSLYCKKKLIKHEIENFQWLKELQLVP